jgi:membrane protein implicated in regulation of membrane protease activity
VAGSSPGQTILGAVAVAVLLFVQSYVSRRFQNRKHQETTEKLDTVEQTVNGNFEKALARIDQLAAALTAHDIPVPPTPTMEET